MVPFDKVSIQVIRLKRLTIEDFYYLQGIHTLNISDRRQVIDQVFKYLHEFHNLELGCNYEIHDHALDYLKGIKILKIQFCWFSDRAFHNLQGLKYLELDIPYGCDPLTRKILEKLKKVKGFKYVFLN